MTGADRPARRDRLRVLGWLLAFGPLLVAGALGGLWVRSLRTPEVREAVFARYRVARDPWEAVRFDDRFRYEAAEGVLGLSWTRDWSPVSITTSDLDTEFRDRIPTWRTSRTPLPPGGPSFGRKFGRVGAWSVCRLTWRSTVDPLPIAGQRGLKARASLVVPFWLAMIPLALPAVWWSWCPKGRAWPRWTVRRLVYGAMATAGLCGILVAFAKASSLDRAIVAIESVGGRFEVEEVWGEAIITGVDLTARPGPSGLDDARMIRLRSSFAALPRLKSLRIDSDRVTTEGLGLLADQPGLTVLSIAGTRADDDALIWLRDHPNLRLLDLGGTLVTEAGLGHLRSLPQLREINLDQLDIGDAGLVHLEGMPRLRTISLRDNRFVDRPKPPPRLTEAGVYRLFQTTPRMDCILVPDGRWEQEPGF